MISSYPACLFKEEDGWSVISPDLGYPATCGETLEEASEMAIDALAGYLYTAREDGGTVPPPSRPDAVCPGDVARELDFEAAEASVEMVSADVEAYARAHFRKSAKKPIEWSDHAERRVQI